MISTVSAKSALPFSTKMAASLMRHFPMDVRRVRVWHERLYRSLGGGGWDDDDAVDCAWPTSVQGPIRGRLSGMKMKLDLTDWLQRRAYFTGRFYQIELEQLLSTMMRPGDNFVDVGANIGLVTLHAAALVGRKGAVWAFEPNPEVYERLTDHIRMNHLECRAFNMGLGRERGALNLRRFGRHTGKATLVSRPDEPTESVTVEICRGDQALHDLNTTKPTIFKIDVEGFEVSVLEGLGKMLDGDVAVVIEVTRSWLNLAGSSAEQLHEVLGAHGLKPYSFELSEGRFSRKLVVAPLTGPLSMDQYDCLFMRPDSIFATRLEKVLSDGGVG
jgi:FkbM family methyltransferase